MASGARVELLRLIRKELANREDRMTASVKNAAPVGFICACVIAFFASVAATIHFHRSMCCELAMPGGWTMSMMWVAGPRQTWIGSGISFVAMWLAMMVMMMLPSALPMFLKCPPHKGCSIAMLLMALSYFAVWLVVGAGLYLVGAAFGSIATCWQTVSRAVPLLSGVFLIAAGAIQFTPWKLAAMSRCRIEPECALLNQGPGASMLQGCNQGVACCACCATFVVIQLILGMMSPLVMLGVAVAIAMEKLLPRPERTARAVGAVVTLMGTGMFARAMAG